MAITNADYSTSRKYLNLIATTHETLSQGIVLPTSKPVTPHFSHTVSQSDLPLQAKTLFSYDTMFIVVLDSIVHSLASTTVYGEVYVDGVIQDGTVSDLVNAGEYVSAYFSVNAPIGSLVEVFMWQSTADSVVIEETHWAATPYNIKVSNKKEFLVDRMEEQYLPDYTGRVGSGSGTYLKHGEVLSYYNSAGSIDNNGGDLPLVTNDTYGFTSIYGNSLPYIGISNRTSSRWPSSRNTIAEVYYAIVKR